MAPVSPTPGSTGRRPLPSRGDAPTAGGDHGPLPPGTDAEMPAQSKDVTEPPTSCLGTSVSMWVVYLNVTLYALCYMAQVPVLPYLVKSYGADSSAYGYLMTCFSVLQFLGGLAAGPLLDAYGAAFMFWLSFVASALSYATIGFSTGLPLLFLSKVPTVMQHAVMAARALVTLSSDAQNRSRVLGYVAVAYGIGFALGPAIGGVLSNHNLKTAALVATAGSVGSAVMVQAALPWGLHRSDHHRDGEGEAPKTFGGLGALWRVCCLPRVPSLIVTKAIINLSFALFQTIFTLALQDVFGLKPKDNGMVLSYAGSTTIAAQGLVVSWATQRCSEERLVTICVWLLALSFLGLSAVRTVPHLLVALVPLITAAMLVTTVNTAQLTKAVPAASTGAILAVDMSIGSGARILSPIIGTKMLETYGFWSIGAVSCVLNVFLAALLHCGLI